MVGGMVGYKAVAARAALQQEADVRHKIRILAGAKPFHAFLEHAGADHIGNGYRAQQGKAPPPSFLPIIHNGKNDEEYIQGRPKDRVAEIGEDKVKKRIGPLAVQFKEKPFVPFVDLPP